MVSVLALFTCLTSIAEATKWPRYTDEEMFAKADYIVVGKLAQALPEQDGWQQAKLEVSQTLLSEQGGRINSTIVLYHAADSPKSIGLKIGSEGVWLLRRGMAGNLVVHPQQFRPSDEAEALEAKIAKWLPIRFEVQLALVKKQRSIDPEGDDPTTMAAAIDMFRRSEQIRLLPNSDDQARTKDWIERLQAMLAVYQTGVEFPAEAATDEDRQQVMELIGKIAGEKPEPGTPLFDRMANQAPGLLAHHYSSLFKQTIVADKDGFARSTERVMKNVKDADASRLKTRPAALNYLIELSENGQLR